MRIASFLIFITVLLFVTIGGHIYIWRRLVRDNGLVGVQRKVGTSLLVGLCALMLLASPLARFVPGHSVKVIAFVGYGWMGMAFLLISALALWDLARGAKLITDKMTRSEAESWDAKPSADAGTDSEGSSKLTQPTDVLDGQSGLCLDTDSDTDRSRRLFLQRALSTGVAAGSLGIGTYGMVQAVSVAARKDVEVPLPRWPKPLDGLRIVQISDLHVGALIQRDYVEALARQVAAAEPDVIALTGDFVDGSVRTLGKHLEPLTELNPRIGTYFVTGNHEYYSGADDWLAWWRDRGVRVLRNERVRLTVPGKDGALSQFDIAGVDDWNASRFGGDHGHDLDRAMKDHDGRTPVILLAHQPKAIADAARLGVDLQLSGHTHGGQIWPFNLLVGLVQPFIAGLGKRGNTTIYTSRGTGFWGPPMRVGAESEMTVLHLRSAA